VGKCRTRHRQPAVGPSAYAFRDLGSSDFEIRPDFLWTINDHTFEFTVDARKTHQTPDSYGMIYFHGTPIASVPFDSKYSTPWAYANENYIRSTASDKWYVNNFLTVNNRFAFTYRTLNLERNGDSSSTAVNAADKGECVPVSAA